MKLRAFGLAALAVATLAACGGATVDSADVTESQATQAAETAGAAAATEASTSESSSRSTATVTVTSTRAGAAGPAAPGTQDQPASAVDSIPQQASRYSAGEQAFLNHLRENGLNIDGVEDQLTVTGASVCANDTITRDAVAGQLVEQRRTDMNPEAVGQLLTDTARANLC